jgi:hypothetical protein
MMPKPDEALNDRSYVDLICALVALIAVGTFSAGVPVISAGALDPVVAWYMTGEVERIDIENLTGLDIFVVTLTFWLVESVRTGNIIDLGLLILLGRAGGAFATGVWRGAGLAVNLASRNLFAQAPPFSTKLAAKPRVHRPLGCRLRRLALFLFSPVTFHRVFEPILSDLLNEHIEAIDEDRRLERKFVRKAPWVRIRGYLAFWQAFCLQGPLSFVKHLVQMWKLVP